MPKFSERMGIQPVKSVLQTDSMDNDLRNGLWNVLTNLVWPSEYQDWNIVNHPTLLMLAIWQEYFKRPSDDMPTSWPSFLEEVRSYFMGAEWWQVYDFIEYIGSFGSGTVSQYADLGTDFRRNCNVVLAKELSAYRFTGLLLTRLTSDQEIEAVETAIEQTRTSSPLSPVPLHLSQALTLLSNRQSPDYRNSIKESISAVEALCKLIVGDEQTTLGAALNRIETERKITLHKRYKDAFVALYAYTSDADGIRHALKDAPTVDLQDALFMLVTCSAFVNYLLARVAEAGIQLGKQG